MTPEDEEFNRIEREAKQRMEAVSAAVAQQELVQWGVDWGWAGQAPSATIIKRLPDGWIEVLAVEYGPERTWKGLTDEEIETLIHHFGGDPHTLLDEVDARLRKRNI